PVGPQHQDRGGRDAVPDARRGRRPRLDRRRPEAGRRPRRHPVRRLAAAGGRAAERAAPGDRRRRAADHHHHPRPPRPRALIRTARRSMEPPVKHLTRVLLAFSLLALPACGAQSAQSAPNAESATLIWAIETQPVTFNPHLWAQNKARLLVFNQFDALISRGRDGSFQPWLARSWEVSDDGLTYTLHLRDDVTFHDGTRFDAAAVKANFDQLLVPGYNPTVASIQLKAFKKAEVVSPTTVKITLKEPDALFLDFLASPYAGQVSPKSLRTAKDLKFGGPDLVGTGPFILDRYIQGQE